MTDINTPDTPAPAAPQVQPGPWENDIRQTFADPQTAAAVDQFLRARVQPRVTQLEQELAGARGGQELLTAFQEDPVGTFNAVQQQLVEAGYLPAQAQQMAQAAYAESQQQPAAAAPAQTAAAGQEDPRVAEMYAAYQQAAELEAYDAQVAAIVNDPANADINPNRYHTFVAAADGDFQKALEMYRADVAGILRDYGIDPTTATPQQQESAAALAEAGQQEAAGAPPVMGTGSAAGAGAPIPTQPDYRGMDGLNKAIDDAVAAMVRKGPAPPVA